MKLEHGYTLVEAMIAIAITGFLVTAIGMVVQLMTSVPERGSDQVNALHSIQNAAHWVTMDGQMASSATGGDSLILTLPDASTISYLRYGTELNRLYGSDNQTVAEDVASVNFTVQDKFIYMTIVATPSSRWDISENKTYRVYMRPTG